MAIKLDLYANQGSLYILHSELSVLVLPLDFSSFVLYNAIPLLHLLDICIRLHLLAYYNSVGMRMHSDPS